MNRCKTSRGYSTTRRRRKLRKEIREFITITICGMMGAIALCAMFVGAVIQESEKLCPVTPEEVSEVAE